MISSFPTTEPNETTDKYEEQNQGSIYQYDDNTNNKSIQDNDNDYQLGRTYELHKSSYISKEDEEFANQSIKYEIEIMKLKKEIKNLQTQNIFLNAQINEQETEINSLQNDIETANPIIDKINEYIQQNTGDNSPMHYIQKISSEYNEVLAKEEFVNGLKTLYLSQNTVNSDQIDIKTIWRWVKQLVSLVNDLNVENEKIVEQINITSQNQNNYINYCNELIQNLGLNSVEQLKRYINELILKKNIDNKRVHKLRKMLG